MKRVNHPLFRLAMTANACVLLLMANSAIANTYRYDRYVPTLKVTEPSNPGGSTSPGSGGGTGSGGSTSPSGGGASSPGGDIGDTGGTGGNTTSPSFFLSTNTLDFGALDRNQTSGAKSLLVTNDSSVGLTGLTLLSGPNFPATTDCTSTLAAGASCQVSIQFSPKVSETSLTEFLSVGASGATVQKVSLTGRALSPVLTWVAPESDFGTVFVKAPTTRIYTLQNSGSLSANALMLDKGTSTELELTSGSCIGLSSLPAGQSCTVTATLTPQTSGAKGGYLSATANLADPKSISWSASVPKSEQTVNGALTNTTYNFGTVTEATFADKTITVRAGADSNVSGLYVTLPPNQPLSLTSNTCGTSNNKVTLAANNSCSFTVRYGDSTASTMSSAEIVVTSNAENSPTKISVSGKTVFAAASGVVERFASFPNLSTSSAEGINGPSAADYTIQRTGNIVTYNGAGAYSTSQVVSWSASSPIWPISGNIFLQRTTGGMSVIQYDGGTRTVLHSQPMPNFTTGGITYDSATGYYYVLSSGSSTAGPALARFTVNNNTIGNLTLLGNNQDGRVMILPGFPVVLGPDGWLYATRSGTVYRFSTDGSSYQTVSTLAPPTGYTQPTNSWGTEAAGIVFDRQGNALRMFNNQILSYPALGNGQYGTPTAIAGQFNTSGSTNGTGSAARLNTNAVFRQAPDGTGFVISPGQVQRVR